MTLPIRHYIRQVQQGDPSGIADICEAFAPLIDIMSRKYRYLYHTFGEARAEATFAVIECIYRYDLNGAETVAWSMVASIRNIFRCEEYRFEKEKQTLERCFRSHDGATDIPDYLEDRTALLPEDHVIRQDDCRQLQDALATLDEKERLLVCQRVQEKRTLRELGECYGYPTPTVQGIVRRGMKKLRLFYGVEKIN